MSGRCLRRKRLSVGCVFTCLALRERGTGFVPRGHQSCVLGSSVRFPCQAWVNALHSIYHSPLNNDQPIETITRYLTITMEGSRPCCGGGSSKQLGAVTGSENSVGETRCFQESLLSVTLQNNAISFRNIQTVAQEFCADAAKDAGNVRLTCIYTTLMLLECLLSFCFASFNYQSFTSAFLRLMRKRQSDQGISPITSHDLCTRCKGARGCSLRLHNLFCSSN